MELVITHPQGYELSKSITQGIEPIYDQGAAFEAADFIYAKNWSAFHAYGQVIPVEKDWMVSQEKMDRTQDAYFMHCLPVRRNVVVADEVIDRSTSLVKQQALNRVVAVQTVLLHMLQSL